MQESITRIRIPEEPVPGKPLGRHIEHDPLSRTHPFAVAATPALLEVVHKRHGEVFNQGRIGSCTGNAAAGCINTEPLWHVDVKRLLHELDALDLYELATTLDGFAGAYPPDDTGSSGLAAAKAAKAKGWIKAYTHTFSIDGAVAALQLRPLMIGVYWYEGFDHPDADGKVKVSGQVRGGHEFEALGYHPQHTNSFLDDLVECVNSWTPSWGKKGHFFFTVRDLASLLAQQGDVTVLVP